MHIILNRTASCDYMFNTCANPKWSVSRFYKLSFARIASWDRSAPSYGLHLPTLVLPTAPSLASADAHHSKYKAGLWEAVRITACPMSIIIEARTWKSQKRNHKKKGGGKRGGIDGPSYSTTVPWDRSAPGIREIGTHPSEKRNKAMPFVHPMTLNFESWESCHILAKWTC